MDKYIGFDVTYKQTVACVVQKGKPDNYSTLPTDVNLMRLWLDEQRNSSARLYLNFEVSDQTGWSHDRRQRKTLIRTVCPAAPRLLRFECVFVRRITAGRDCYSPDLLH